MRPSMMTVVLVFFVVLMLLLAWHDSTIDRSNYAKGTKNEKVAVPYGIPSFATNVKDLGNSWYTFNIGEDCFIFRDAYRASTLAHHPNGCE